MAHQPCQRVYPPNPSLCSNSLHLNSLHPNCLCQSSVVGHLILSMPRVQLEPPHHCTLCLSVTVLLQLPPSTSPCTGLPPSMPCPCSTAPATRECASLSHVHCRPRGWCWRRAVAACRCPGPLCQRGMRSPSLMTHTAGVRTSRWALCAAWVWACTLLGLGAASVTLWGLRALGGGACALLCTA